MSLFSCLLFFESTEECFIDRDRRSTRALFRLCCQQLVAGQCLELSPLPQGSCRGLSGLVQGAELELKGSPGGLCVQEVRDFMEQCKIRLPTPTNRTLFCARRTRRAWAGFSLLWIHISLPGKSKRVPVGPRSAHGDVPQCPHLAFAFPEVLQCWLNFIFEEQSLPAVGSVAGIRLLPLLLANKKLGRWKVGKGESWGRFSKPLHMRKRQNRKSEVHVELISTVLSTALLLELNI